MLRPTFHVAVYDIRHDRNDEQWVVDRSLRAGGDGRRRPALVDVVDADDVGEEDTVELAPLGGAREVRPVFQAGIGRRLIPWVGPQSMIDVADTVHVERVDVNFLRHTTRCFAVLPMGLFIRATSTSGD